MSDYLWDKTGEPEEDVAELEDLLGTLRYKPRPLEIPASAIREVEAARPRPVSIFSRPRLAIAASLLLTLLAGTWFVTRQDEPQKNRIAEVEQGSRSVQNGQPGAAVASNVETAENASNPNVEQTKPLRVGTPVVAISSPRRASPLRRRQLAARRNKLPQRAEENAPAPREEIAVGGALQWQVDQPMTPQQREATEQLMFALRLASAKLNYAQREMQEIGRAGK